MLTVDDRDIEGEGVELALRRLVALTPGLTEEDSEAEEHDDTELLRLGVVVGHGEGELEGQCVWVRDAAGDTVELALRQGVALALAQRLGDAVAQDEGELVGLNEVDREVKGQGEAEADLQAVGLPVGDAEPHTLDVSVTLDARDGVVEVHPDGQGVCVGEVVELRHRLDVLELLLDAVGDALLEILEVVGVTLGELETEPEGAVLREICALMEGVGPADVELDAKEVMDGVGAGDAEPQPLEEGESLRESITVAESSVVADA